MKKMIDYDEGSLISEMERGNQANYLVVDLKPLIKVNANVDQTYQTYERSNSNRTVNNKKVEENVINEALVQQGRFISSNPVMTHADFTNHIYSL